MYNIGDNVLFLHNGKLRVGDILLKNPRYYVIRFFEDGGRENAVVRSANGRGIRGKVQKLDA